MRILFSKPSAETFNSFLRPNPPWNLCKYLELMFLALVLTLVTVL